MTNGTTSQNGANGSSVCRNCGAPRPTDATLRWEFCGKACRNAYSNRRQLRGAQLYDMMMELRHNRKRGQEDKLWSLACRLMADWKAEDDQAGIVSWGNPQRVIDQNGLHNLQGVLRVGRMDGTTNR